MTDFYDIIDRYNKSKTYMSKKNIFHKTEKNWKMYTGKQWEAVEDSKGMENLPMLNFIKPTIKYKVSTIAQHAVTACFSDLNNENSEVVSNLNKLFDVSWDKAKMNRVAWDNLNNAAIQGDSYVYWGEGGDTRITPQILHNTQIHLGDENITDIQDQPWIIIEERTLLEVVRERARLQGVDKEELGLIQPDEDGTNTLVNKEEVNNKVTTLLYMEKDIKTGVVSIARCTKRMMYEKIHPIQQTKGGEYFGFGLTKYPIVPMIWEKSPNNARGVSEVEQLIPNQLELNKTLARRSMSVKMTAYPRMAVDDSAIANPEDLDKVGAVIKLNGGQTQSITNMISYLAPQAMSGDAKQLSEDLLDQTRSLAGASDAQLGNVDLSRVSGTAAQTIRDQQQVPLNEQVSMYQNFVEDVALLWFDMWKTYYPEGVEMDGISVAAEDIGTIVPNVRIDIAEDTTLSRMAAQQELTNLFNNNKITFEEYVDAYPEHSSVPKDVFLRIVANRKMQQEQAQQQQAQMQGQGEEQMQTGEELQYDEAGNPIIDNDVDEGVKTGGASSGSYQAVQSMLAR